MSDGERCLDVRGLPPCEPMELILAAARELSPGQSLLALVSREPVPLLPLLEQRGLRWRIEDNRAGCCRLRIERPATAP
ncbi:MAG: DUF2249 domain-containing protein [Proteobacteria bacterium]|nr:DUF2249 domain-containing protein [Pseudomonadota bacterium]